MIQTRPAKRRHRTVPRTDLLMRLKASSAVPVVAIVAPPGYGKTTLPEQWAERLYLSPHTVKTQAISIYRKLGVSSRSGAIRRAQDLGLLLR
jgi:ATP/maltotriose-dependent transcriptional regulator MalT